MHRFGQYSLNSSAWLLKLNNGIIYRAPHWLYPNFLFLFLNWTAILVVFRSFFIMPWTKVGLKNAKALLILHGLQYCCKLSMFFEQSLLHPWDWKQPDYSGSYLKHHYYCNWENFFGHFSRGIFFHQYAKSFHIGTWLVRKFWLLTIPFKLKFLEEVCMLLTFRS